MSDINWRDATDEYKNPQPQETTVTEQENPAVSKLREAFDTARNAIIEGSELAKQVTELQGIVNTLRSETTSLQRDLEYIRNRNRELDEQVMQVRQSRDEAIQDASNQRARAYTAEQERDSAREVLQHMDRRVETLEAQVASVSRERDDAMVMALEYETKFKEAAAKLAKIEEAMHGVKSEEKPVEQKPLPHYVTQPRDEETKQFRPFDEPKTYDSGSQGSF
jgi:chromosome segregation ATPase